MSGRSAFAVITLCLASGLALSARAQTNFTVTNPGANYNFIVDGPGVSTNFCPTIDLRAGNTYTFTIDTLNIHPVDIVTDIGHPYLDFAYDGASPQDVFQDVIVLTIPATNFPSTLYYICDAHGFFGQLNVLPPLAEAPTQNVILSITLAPANVTVKSTGADTPYVLVPEYRSNLLSGDWLSVPTFTNTFANGTNTTTFDRLEPLCGSNVFLRISQRPPN